MKLTDFTPGTRVFSRKWKTHGTVDHPARKLVHVVMDNTHVLRALPVDDLEIIRETPVQTAFRTKLHSTRQYGHATAAPRPNSRQKRLRARNGATVRPLLTRTQQAALYIASLEI